MKTLTFAVFGGEGYVGGAVARAARDSGHEAFTLTRYPQQSRSIQCDLLDREAVLHTLNQLRPNVVVNAASVKHSWATTTTGSLNAALGTNAINAHLVQLSTDAVFPGGESYWAESDEPSPSSWHGCAKAASEIIVTSHCASTTIVRPSLVLGDGRSKHEEAVRRGAAGGNEMFFTDGFRMPLHVDDLASGILVCATTSIRGPVHMVGPDVLNRYELACLIASREELPNIDIKASAGQPEPQKLLLATERSKSLGIKIRGAREFLA